QARMHEAAHRRDCGWLVLRDRTLIVVMEAAADEAELFFRIPHHYAPADVVDARDPRIAMDAQIIGDDEAAERPAHQYRLHELPLLDDRGNVGRPEIAVAVGLHFRRCFRHTVAAKIDGDEAEFVGKAALELAAPGKMMLRPAMHEEDRRRILAAPFADVKARSASA